MEEFIEIEKVQFLEDAYPRDNFNNETVNNYVLNIDALPAIVISREYILIDGYHRLLAHRLAKKSLIRAEIIDCPQDQILWMATKLNAKHGLQLRKEEKRRLARSFYKDSGRSYSEISEVLAISEGTLSEWLRDLNEAKKEEQQRQIVDLFLRCLTQEEIANKLGLTHGRISQIVNDFKTELINKPIVPESLQLFNVWNFANRDKRYGLDFEGAIPGQIIENVLYYYSQPFDLVVDPMGGGGTTNDVAKTMFRRYQSYDLNPSREDIQKHDIRKGYPQKARNCDLIILDPPYFNMVFKNLFNNIAHFYTFIAKLAQDSYVILREKGIVAFIIQDMTELGNYCLSGESYYYFRMAGFQCIDHVSVPLSTQQFLPQQVEKAKSDKHLLGRNRDLYIFQKE